MAGNRLLVGVAGFLLLISLLGAGFFIWLSAQRAISPLEAALFSVILLVFQVLFGLMAGRLSARDDARREYRLFVGSALRRTYGLAEGLTRVQNSMHEAVRRMASRSKLEPSARAQLWGEIMNLVYSQLNELLSLAEASIEDWRQFGPEEVEKLQNSHRLKEQRIAEITERLRQLYELIGDLSASPTYAEGAMDRLGAVALSLERELDSVRRRSAVSPVEEVSALQKGEVRKLLLMGAFEEAVDAYSQLISLNPSTHTLYIGRARARYLAGDKEGALGDLDDAAQLHGEDPVIKRTRQQIEQGQLGPVAVSTQPAPYLTKAFAGNQALAVGRCEEARALYEEASKLGLMTPFVCINQAMVEILEANPQAAREALDGIDPARTGPYMRAQWEALIVLCVALEDGEVDLTSLQLSLDECDSLEGKFNMNKSPLRFLESGLKATGALHDEMLPVFDSLSGALHERYP